MIERFNHRAALPALVAVAAIAVYLNSLANGFAFDDVFIVQNNTRVNAPSGLADIWLTPYWTFTGVELGLYRPFIIFLFAGQWLLGGGAAWVFHAGNIVLHATASILVFYLLRRLAGNGGALAGALIFAVHPVHTEAVANIVGQAEIVAAIAVLAACLVHAARPVTMELRWPRRLVIVALYFIGLATKESAVVLPALLLLVDLAERRIPLRISAAAEYMRAMLMPLLLMCLALAAYLLLRFHVMDGALTGVDAAPSMPFLREDYRVLNALRAFPEFFRLLIFPADLAADYAPAALLAVDGVRPMVILGALLLAGVTLLALITPWRPELGFAAAWFLITIITVSNLFFPIGVVLAERTLYLPSVAVSAVAAYAFAALAVHRPHRLRLAWAGIVVLLLAGGVRTWLRNPVWTSTETIWHSLVRDQPNSYRTQWITGAQFWFSGKLEEATVHFDLAYRLYRRDATLLTEYANLMIARAQYDRAAELLEEARTISPRGPSYVNSLLLLSFAYAAGARYDEAVAASVDALRNGALPPSVLTARGFAQHQMGEFQDAAASWRAAGVRSGPSAWLHFGLRARSLGAAGLDAHALEAVREAETLTTDSLALHMLGSVRQAVTSGCYRAAVAAMPDPAASPPPANDPIASACDELDHPFGFLRPAQNASESQNASERAPPG